MEYYKIKDSDQYRFIIDDGFIDTTSSAKLKLGSLEFTKNNERYGITGKTGRVYRATNSKYAGWVPAKISDPDLGFLMSHEDYIRALNVIVSRIQYRDNKFWSKIEENKHLSIEIVFSVKRSIGIEILYDVIIQRLKPVHSK